MPIQVRFATFAEAVFRAHKRVWKATTCVVNYSHLRNQLMPTFGEAAVADISSHEVMAWFAGLSEKPAAANRALSLLSLIMREAEFRGHRLPDSSPCVGIRRYKCSGRERYLSVEEMRRLGAALKLHEPTAPIQVAVVRLLLLTGCRQSEVRTLPWSAYRAGNLYLFDSKTGPRTVWLSKAARRVLDSLPRSCEWVFPSAAVDACLPVESLYRCWRSVRCTADLPALRLHDLRHSYASFALRRGESLLTIGRLLGHRDPATTLKYTHFADDLARSAVERVGRALTR